MHIRQIFLLHNRCSLWRHTATEPIRRQYFYVNIKIFCHVRRSWVVVLSLLQWILSKLKLKCFRFRQKTQQIFCFDLFSLETEIVKLYFWKHLIFSVQPKSFLIFQFLYSFFWISLALWLCSFSDIPLNRSKSCCHV